MLEEATRPGPAPGREQQRVVGRMTDGARRQLADPLFRNAYALMVNAGATGVLGVVYWILAARYYDDVDVGRGSAAISAMMLLSGFAALNLTGMLSRFLPRAGPATRAFILKTYLASGLAAGTITVGFLLTLDRWGPSFAHLGGVGPGVAFTGAVIAWGVFTLQDVVLPALRSAVWVPLENIVFGLLKIALVVGLAVALPHDGVFLSWMIPVALSVVPINLLIFGRLAPRHERATRDRHAPPAFREVRRFLAGDYVGALFVLGVVYLVPVAVAAQVEPRIYAYFYVAWIVGGIIDLLAVNMAISLTVEGTLDRERLGANARAALRRTVRILLPIVVATVVLARPTVGIYGAGYARYAAPLLQLLALSTLPRALVELYFGVLRARSRTTHLAVLQGLRCVMVIGLTLPFTGTFGIRGAGWAVLISQSITALLVAPGLLAVVGGRWRAGRWVGRRLRVRRAPVPRWVLAAPGLAVPNPRLIEGRHIAPSRSNGRRHEPRAGHRVLRSLVVMPPVVMPAVAVVAGLVLFALPLRTADLGAMNGYGLVSVLPVASLAGLGLLTLGYVMTVGLDRPRRLFLAVQLGLLVVCLHGVTAFVESEPRFPTAWQHLGFLDYIGRTGQAAPALDARFNWPGFFAVATFFARAVGISDPAVLLKAAPVVAELLYVAAYMVLLARIRASWRTRWFAAFLLVVANWVGQDYFSPQSFAFFIYLLVLALVLTWFGASRRPVGRWPVPRALARVPPWARGPLDVRRSKPPGEAGELPPLPATAAQRTAVALLIVGLFAVSAASHQLSPFMTVVAVAALVVARRCELTGLPLLFGVIVVSWLSYMAAGYWTGHLDVIFGNVGSLGSNFEASVQGRAMQSNPVHTTVLYVRVGVAAVISGLAVLGTLRRRRSGVRDRALMLLAIVPLTALGLQSYGGEVGLRVYLFALPGLCALAASLFFGARPNRRSWLGLSAALVCALLLVGGFLVARYGNERAERMTGGEVAALDYIYDRGGDVRVMWLTPRPEADATPSMPWGGRALERVAYAGGTAPRDPDDVAGVIGDLWRLGSNAYLVVNRAQVAYLESKYNFPPDWGDRLRARLDADSGVRRVYANRDAAVYVPAVPTAGPAPLGPMTPGFSVGTTPLTPVGIAVTFLLVAVLVAREVLRIRLPVRARARLVPLSIAAYVLLAGWAAVVVERFVRLS